MSELTTQQTFAGPVEKVFAGIRNYERYPEFLPGVTGVQILPAEKPNSVCQVRYELKLIKSFFYTLNMFEKAPNRIWWDLADSNIMKHSTGSWTLASDAEKTHATYAVDIGFSGLVPQKIVDQITKANLPMMMQGFQKLINATNAA